MLNRVLAIVALVFALAAPAWGAGAQEPGAATSSFSPPVLEDYGPDLDEQSQTELIGRSGWPRRGASRLGAGRRLGSALTITGLVVGAIGGGMTIWGTFQDADCAECGSLDLSYQSNSYPGYTKVGYRGARVGRVGVAMFGVGILTMLSTKSGAAPATAAAPIDDATDNEGGG